MRSINILTLFLLAWVTSSCCILNLNTVEMEPTASLQGTCLTSGGDDSSELEPLLGFQIGNYFVFTPEACAEISLAAGVQYSTRGASSQSEGYEGDGDDFMGYTQDTKLRTQYIDIPIVARMPITEEFSAYAGPQASFLVGAKRTYEVNGQDAGSEKGTDGLNGVDLGFTVGVKYELNNGLQLGLGFDQGLRDIYKSEYGSKSKNQVIKATVGLNINKFKNR